MLNYANNTRVRRGILLLIFLLSYLLVRNDEQDERHHPEHQAHKLVRKKVAHGVRVFVFIVRDCPVMAQIMVRAHKWPVDGVGCKAIQAKFCYLKVV